MSVISLVLATAAQAVTPSTACPGRTTPEVNACAESELAVAEARWHRYAAATVKRIAEDSPDNAVTTSRVVTAEFERAESAWTFYRAAECQSVSSYWSEGTIRGHESASCETRATILHTHAIWRDWLTYPDSTPPILPEPDIEGGLGRRRR